jgi:uncharacterized heparinase superfamily protein
MRKPAGKILRQVRRGVQNAAYNNPFYRKMLAAGETVDRLYFTLPDPWPGDAAAGLAMMTDQRHLFENTAAAPMRHAAPVLRNLRAVGTDAARHMAVRLIDNWMNHHDSWSEAEWAPHVLGERIAAWTGFYEFYATAANRDFVARLAASLQRQWKHLVRTMPPLLVGPAGLQAIRGLIYGGLNFPEGDKALGLACNLLNRQLAVEVLRDGGHISRNPSAQLHMLRHLLDLRAVFKISELDPPDTMRMVIANMVPVLRFFRHGDGGLGLFHGAVEETPLLIDAVITQAEGRVRALRRLPNMGYERLTAGRSLLLVDTGAPAPRGHDRSAHAGLMSFEFGHGRERLIVNCGAVEMDGEWRKAMAATAAHSTLTVEDTNACEILPTGGLAATPPVEAQRYEQSGVQSVEMTHTAYRSAFGITHQRLLSLSQDGEELRGCEIIQGSGQRSFCVRWHLHPLVQASLSQNGETALLRTASGIGWRLRVEGLKLELEPSVYCGQGAPRRSQQLKVVGRSMGVPVKLAWNLLREKKL